MDHSPTTASPMFASARSGGLILRASPSALARQRLAARDVFEGLRLWRLIAALGWLDIRLRYRGSLLGPFWLTLSTAVMVGALGFLYSTLFRQPIDEYLPFLALSLVLWNATAAVVTEACTVFTAAEASIRANRLPFLVHVGRLAVRQALILAHNAAVIVAVYLYFRIHPREAALLALPGFGLWLLDWLGACLLLGSLCARFRDIPQIVASVMQIAFFVTPVVWRPQQMRAGAEYLTLNPFYDLLEIIRAPLLNAAPAHGVWLGAAAYSAGLWLLAWLAFSRARGRLAFWV